MTDHDDNTSTLRERVHRSLEPLHLGDEDEEVATLGILEHARFLDDSRTTGTGGGQLGTNSTFFDFSRKIEGVVERFSSDGLTRQSYLQAALKQPQLFAQKSETIAANIRRAVERFADEGLTCKDYLRAALKQPTLLVRKPETIAANIEGVVERFSSDGLTRRGYLKAALKCPSLFYQNPETTAANIEGVVERFSSDGLTRRGYLKAALKHPQMFYQKPETIILHIERIIRLYDDDVINLPAQRGHTARRNDRDGPPHQALLSVLLTHPSLITLDATNYELRELHRRMNGAEPRWRNLTHSRRHIEDELRTHLSHPDSNAPVPPSDYLVGDGPPTEEQARRFVLRALMREGFIKGSTLGRA